MRNWLKPVRNIVDNMLYVPSLLENNRGSRSIDSIKLAGHCRPKYNTSHS